MSSNIVQNINNLDLSKSSEYGNSTDEEDQFMDNQLVEGRRRRANNDDD